ncbi:phage/plasmid primase, P4 family [Lacticaseibacillus sp. N501-2]|uniref:phage/plasmid primase, P4 family n=1 Tax=Lacticaseibacillus salsurae TaxID=3367729 RepID=UPI0038B346C7
MTVYFSKGYTTRNMTPVVRDRAQESDFEAVLDYVLHPDNVNTTDLEQYKANTATYLMAGTLEPAIRNDANFKAASLLFVDFDHIGDEAKFLQVVKDKLSALQYLLYPSISYGQADKGARYHLVLNLSHPLQQQEHDRKLTKEPLTAYVCGLLGMKSDSAMNTWSQLFGAPTLTTTNTGHEIVHTDGKPLDVDSIVANYHPTATPIQGSGSQVVKTVDNQLPTAHKATNTLPDDYVHDLLAEWTYEQLKSEHLDKIETEQGFATQLMLVLNSYRAGEISVEALHDAMTVFARGDAELAAGNENKLTEHLHSAYTPNKLPFRTLYQTDAPVYLRASEDAEYTQRSVKLALVRAGKARRKANKEKTNKASLSNADIADILIECIPMWANRHDTPAKSLPLIQIYNPATGIYTASQDYFNTLVGLVDRESNSTRYKEVYAKLLEQGRVRDTQGLECGDMIAASNLIVDISHGETVLHTFSPRYHFTSKIATAYPVDGINRYLNFKTITGETITPVSLLQKICSGEPSKVRQLLEVLGDACQPMKTRNQATWLLGKQSNTRENGSNGKSTFLDIVQAVVGQANVATLTIDQMAGQFAMEQVVGKSVIIGDDVQAGVYVKDTANYNSLTTGGVIKVEGKGKDAYSYRSCAGVIQATNQLPKIANQTGGTNRRMHIIVFDAHIDKDKADGRIRSEFIKSQEFREFMFALAVAVIKGKSRFTETIESRDATERFAKGNDSVNLFVEEEVSTWNSTVVPRGWAYQKYIDFCKSFGYKQPKALPAFESSLVSDFGFKPHKRGSVSPTTFGPIGATKATKGIYTLEFPDSPEPAQVS